jgi:biotin carboxyl carrier protein
LAETSAIGTPGAAQPSAGWLEAVRQVVAAVRASDVTELELGNPEFSIRVRRDPEAARAAATSAPAATAAAHDPDARWHRVVAPFTGVFYRSPTPSARPYANEGDWVDADAVIGLVETMKIFNEVTADCSGRIVRFTAEKSQLVHAGDALVLIEPGERAPAESEPHL